MKQNSIHKKDQRTSAIITLIVSLIVLLCIYFYRFTRITPQPEEVVTTMLINFGDNNNGNGTEEPAPEEGSIASESNALQEVTPPKEQPSTPVSTTPKAKVISGKDSKRTTVKTPKTKEVKKKNTTKKSTKKKNTTNQKNTKSSAKKSNSSAKGKGDGKGKAAIGNLLKGRGNRKGSQGNKGNRGNAGDPLGGSGNGNSKIGVDRRLIAFIPGTMGRGGKQPSHRCSASGTIKIAYTVDKTGRVVSAKRISGISDPCAVKATIAWVKRYVKAEKGASSSKGTYTIRF